MSGSVFPTQGWIHIQPQGLHTDQEVTGKLSSAEKHRTDKNKARDERNSKEWLLQGP